MQSFGFHAIVHFIIRLSFFLCSNSSNCLFYSNPLPSLLFSLSHHCLQTTHALLSSQLKHTINISLPAKFGATHAIWSQTTIFHSGTHTHKLERQRPEFHKNYFFSPFLKKVGLSFGRQLSCSFLMANFDHFVHFFRFVIACVVWYHSFDVSFHHTLWFSILARKFISIFFSCERYFTWFENVLIFYLKSLFDLFLYSGQVGV